MAAITRLTGMAIPGALGDAASFAGKSATVASASDGGYVFLRRRRVRLVPWLTWMFGF